MPPKSAAVVPKRRPFRILALPLARIPRSAAASPQTPTPSQPILEAKAPETPAAGHTTPTSSTADNAGNDKPKTPILYFQVLQPEGSSESTPPSYTQKALDKASEQWLKLGDKKEGSWMKWFHTKGEGLMDRIEYEEWSLKAVHEGRGIKIAKEGEEQQKIEIALVRPTLKDQNLPPLLPKLHRFLIHRIPYHRKMMWRSIAFSPATWPFAIIPVMPNFPLFYVLWRAWSHYKAWRGALYLENLLKLGMIVEKPDSQLGEIYATRTSTSTPAKSGAENQAPDQTATTSGTTGGTVQGVPDSEKRSSEGVPAQAAGKGPAPDGTATPASMLYTSSSTSGADSSRSVHQAGLLLTLPQVPLIVKAFELRANEVVDINRAVEQASLRVQKANSTAAESSEQKPAGEQGKKAGTQWRGNLHR